MDPEQRRAQILQYCREQILARGLSQLRVEDVLRGLSISKGGFYHHFRSLDEILDELVHEDLEEVFHGHSIGASTSSIQELIVLLEIGSDELDGQPGILAGMDNRAACLQYLECLEKHLYPPLNRLLEGILKRGASSGEMRIQSIDGTIAVFEAVNRQLNRMAILGPAEALSEMRSTALRMLFRELDILTEPAIQSLLNRFDENGTLEEQI